LQASHSTRLTLNRQVLFWTNINPVFDKSGIESLICHTKHKNLLTEEGLLGSLPALKLAKEEHRLINLQTGTQKFN
jgi:hypothetical protein